MRITAKDVRAAFVRFESAAKRAGFQTDRWLLQEGDRVNGQAWRVFEVVEHGGLDGLPMTNGEGWVGNDARTAYELLHHMAKTMDAVTELHQEG
jgi:hypothetical protein